MTVLDPGLAPVLAVLADRLERRGLDPHGRVRVSELSRESRHALGGLLGRPVLRDTVTLDLGELDEIARERLHLAGGIVELCEDALGRRLVDRVARRRDRAQTRSGWHAPLLEIATSWAAAWADEVARAGLLTRSADPAATARQAATIVTGLVGARDVAQSRTELAARAAGSAHALDDGTILGACVLRALALDSGEALPRTPAARQELWAQYGVRTDRVSTTVLSLGLRSRAEGRVARLLADAAAARAAVHLTAADLDETGPLHADGPVLVCENPRVLEAASELASPITVVCAMGRPTVVVLRLLGLLREAGIELRYHGDFDWPGVAITASVVDAVDATPWRMTASDYLAGVALTPTGVPLSGAPVPTPWDRELSEAMRNVGVAVHEELLLPGLLHQW